MAKIHGKTKTQEYKIWWRIMQQCRNENRPEYKRIGALGIDLCPEWDLFDRFLRDMGDMPSGCNTIIRLDPKLDFFKANCKWGFVAIGRPKKEKKKKVKKSKKIINPHLLAITVEKELFDYIKKLAIHKSTQLGTQIESNDLIREALTKAFPILSQTDMFGDKIAR